MLSWFPSGRFFRYQLAPGGLLEERSLPAGYMFLTMASPNSEHFTSLAPCICRAKSYVTTFDIMVLFKPERIMSAASVHPR